MRKNGKATPAPVETTTSGRNPRSSFHARAKLRMRLGTFLVVGVKAHATRSFASSDRLSGVENVTHLRSCRSHHGRRLQSWARCPPEEPTSITRNGSECAAPENHRRDGLRDDEEVIG